MENDLALLAPRTLLVIAGTVAAATVILRPRPLLRRALLTRFARRVDLPLPEGPLSRIDRLLTSRDLAALLGGAAALATLATWALAVEPPVVGDGMWPLVVAGAVLTGGAVGAGATAAHQATRKPDQDVPRLARAMAPTLDDYLAPLELRGGRIAAVVPVAVLTAAVIAGAASAEVDLARILSAGPVSAAVLSLLALAGSELAGRRLIDQPQVATTSLELAWSDAIRARVLRDIVTVPICVGTYATFAILLRTGAAIRNEVGRGVADAVVGVAALALAGTVIVVAIVCAAGAPQRHFLRRLWSRETFESAASR